MTMKTKNIKWEVQRLRSINSIRTFIHPTDNDNSSPYKMTHSHIEPAILYWGTPVVLISTSNDDGTPVRIMMCKPSPILMVARISVRCPLPFG